MRWAVWVLTYEYSTLCLSWNRTLQQPAGCPGVGWEKADSRSGGYIEGMRGMNWLLNRLKERSTWLAIFTLAGLFGMKIEPELREHIINAILAVAAVAAFVFRENIRERDQPRQNDQLPPIDLVGRSETVWQFNPVDAASDATPARPGFPRYRDPDDDQLKSSAMPPVRSDENGWNG